MNGISWLFLNVLLIAAAILSTVSMRSVAAPELPSIEAPAKSGKDAKSSKADSQQQQQLSRSNPAENALNIEEIWEKSLFRPDRTEKTESAEDSQDGGQTAEKSDFELTGIAWMGLPGQAKPVAVIKQRQTLPQRSGSRVIRGRRVPAPGGAPAPPASTEPAKPQKVVFSVGDAINETGYILAEINTDENSAVLKRNAERVELKIEFGSDASLQRKTAAVNEANVRQKQREAAAAPSPARLPAPVPAKTAPGGADAQPPGPPGTSAAPGSTTAPRVPSRGTSRTRPAAAEGSTTPADGSAPAESGGSTSQNEKLRQRLEMLNRSNRRPPTRN